MRTIEEVKEWIINNRSGFTEPAGPFVCAPDLLRFIDSDPPCKHLKLLYWPGVVLAPGDLPSGWYFVKNNNNTASDRVTFCPDCGEKLND